MARFLVRPLVHTRVTPNHITTLRLLSGLAACGCLAYGEGPLIHWGAGLFALGLGRYMEETERANEPAAPIPSWRRARKSYQETLIQ